MSGNINDTDVKKIRTLVNDFIKELDEISERNEYIDVDFYKEKYNYIFQTSNSLFKIICDQYISSKFDKNFFFKNLEIMLNAIENIQQNKITQYDASSNIGEMLASHYIPQLKK